MGKKREQEIEGGEVHYCKFVVEHFQVAGV